MPLSARVRLKTGTVVPITIIINTSIKTPDIFLIPGAKTFIYRQSKRIDDVIYLFGASLKDAGKKLFAYIKMHETPASELLNNIR
jgi:hypothetical protein